MEKVYKRLLSFAVALVMVLGLVPAGVLAAEEAPALPTATVTEVDVATLDPAVAPELTFAMNFTADSVTEEQLEYYREWPADYILTSNKEITFNDNGSADGYLAGEYGPFGWLSVPHDMSATLPANTPIPVLEKAMALMDIVTPVTYGMIYESVKSFTCGLFLEEEFLAANPDLEITLELRMFNPADKNESYRIGETYEFGAAPELPTATVAKITNKDLTFAMNFKADEATQEQLDYYGNWYADYVLTVNKDVAFNADGSADGWLSGQYDEWSKDWINVPYGKMGTVQMKAGESLKIMELAAELMNKPGLRYTCREIYETVKDFDCGAFFDEEFLAANPDLVVTLELRIYNPADETENYKIGDTYEFRLETKLPTATVTKITNKDLTFAMNFKADEVTTAQLNYYGNWYADYVLTVNKDVAFNADGSADGWLSGQYDEWSKDWINVPYGKMGTVQMKAGESLKIMELAAELMNKTGLRYTYREVYETVKDFDCGAFFDEEFLTANPDLVVTLELRIYNPADETENYKIGDTYVFRLDTKLPTATITEITNEDLTFAMNFKADEVTEAQLNYYGNWYADYVLTVNKDVAFNADGSADGWLSGQYDEWSKDWINVPYGKMGTVQMKAGESLKIMELAAELMNKTGLRYTYREIYEDVKDFDCGAFFDEEFVEANPDLVVTLELRIYNPADETENYRIGDTYVFTLSDYVAENVQTGVKYDTVDGALMASAEGETVRLLKNVVDEKAEKLILILNNRTLDLNGYTLEAANVVATSGGARIIDSANGVGLLKVAKTNITLPSNDQLPVWCAEDAGFRFVDVEMDIYQEKKTAEQLILQYWFTGVLDGSMKEHLTKIDENNLKVFLRIDYKYSDGSNASLDIVITDKKVVEYGNTAKEPFFRTTIRGLNTLGNATITAYASYDDVEVPGVSYSYTAITE